MKAIRNKAVITLFTLALGFEVIARHLAGAENDEVEYDVHWFGYNGSFC